MYNKLQKQGTGKRQSDQGALALSGKSFAEIFEGSVIKLGSLLSGNEETACLAGSNL
jgi:hypothetical protein